MAVTRKRIWAREIAFLCIALLFVGFFFGEMDLRWLEQPLVFRIRDIIVFFAMIAVMPAAASFLARRRKIRTFLLSNGNRDILLLTILAVLPRLIWQFTVPAKIDSDYGLYIRMGEYYAENRKPLIDNYLLTVAPNTVTFSVLTGLLMRVFGSTEATIIIFTEVVHVCNILLLYGIGRKLTSAPRAFVAAAIFALLPENVFYSNLPGIEAPVMFLELLGLLLILCSKGREPVACAVLCFAGGTGLALSACIRPNAYAVLLVAVILLLRQQGPEWTAKRRIRMLTVLLIGTVMVVFAHQGLKKELFAGQQPADGLGWTMYEGLDLENGGKWTSEKSERCIEIIYANEPLVANEIFRRDAMVRYFGYSFGEKIRLLLRKGGALWYETRYSLFSLEGTEAENRLNRTAHYAWALCMALLISALLYRTGKPAEDRIRSAAWLPVGVVLLTTIWHMIGTSIGRYHYMLIPFVLLTAVILLPGNGEMAAFERRDLQ